MPKDIDEVTKVKEYMNIIPVELDRIKKETDKVLYNIQLLESYEYKFTAEDSNKRWNLVGGPKQTLELIKLRKELLERDETKFLQAMRLEQVQFAEKLENLKV